MPGRTCVSLATICLFSFVPALHAQETVVNLDPGRTKIAFTLGATMHTVEGTFKLKTAQIRFDPANGKASGTIVVDAMSGDSENKGRDKKMNAEVLESEKYREIIFTPNHVQGTLAPEGNSQMQVAGVFRLHGQDHEMTLTLNVHVSAGNELQANAHFSVPYAQWGLKNPSTWLLHVNDSVDVDVHATGHLSSESTHH
ncbi:MAG: YceI family protein [Candidatus Acidiferrales bacterium]